jgi:hypothetical protein
MRPITSNTLDRIRDAIMEKERASARPKPSVDRNVLDETAIAEYRQLAAEVGISDQDMLVEEFRLFLARKDLPTFNLQVVVSYMDEISAKDNPTGLGWHWCPVRAKDADTVLTFGRPSRGSRYSADAKHSNGIAPAVPGSDFYESHRFQVSSHEDCVYVKRQDMREHQSPAYTRTLPLHVLKKIAMIEREFKAGKAVFLVTDYVTQPHVAVNPDPFLMAVIPNSAVSHGKGRFIIDVWDEPGFGLDKQLR